MQGKYEILEFKNNPYPITNLNFPSNPRDATCVEFVNDRINVEAKKMSRLMAAIA